MMGYGYGGWGHPGLEYGEHAGRFGRAAFGGHLGAGIAGFLGLLLIAGVIVLLIMAVRRPHGQASVPVVQAGPVVQTGPTDIEIVRERYARGEIGRREYQRLIDDLKQPM